MKANKSKTFTEMRSLYLGMAEARKTFKISVYFWKVETSEDGIDLTQRYATNTDYDTRLLSIWNVHLELAIQESIEFWSHLCIINK